MINKVIFQILLQVHKSAQEICAYKQSGSYVGADVLGSPLREALSCRASPMEFLGYRLIITSERNSPLHTVFTFSNSGRRGRRPLQYPDKKGRDISRPRLVSLMFGQERIDLVIGGSLHHVLCGIRDSSRPIAPWSRRTDIFIVAFGLGHGDLLVFAHKKSSPTAIICRRWDIIHYSSGESFTVWVIFGFSPSCTGTAILASGSYLRIISLTFSSRVRL